MLKFIKYVERLLIWGILLIMSAILVFAFLDIVYEFVQNVLSPPKYVIDAAGLMYLVSLFLVLLIGLELLETVKAYLNEDIVHVEFIILVAIIAIARKVIVWDFDKYSTENLISLAIMIFALGVTYFLIKKAGRKIKIDRKKNNKNL